MYGKDNCDSFDWINLNCPKLCGHCGNGEYSKTSLDLNTYGKLTAHARATITASSDQACVAGGLACDVKIRKRRSRESEQSFATHFVKFYLTRTIPTATLVKLHLSLI